MTTDVTIVIPDKTDSYFNRYDIYLHDNSGDILAAITIDGGITTVNYRITEEIAKRLFTEFKREIKIDTLI